MRRRVSRVGPLAVLALCSLHAGPVGAAGFTTVDPSVVAMGAGGTGTARGEDPAAAVYNPAALFAAPGWRASLGAVLAVPRLAATGDGLASDTRSATSLPPHLHLAWVGERLSAGVSVTVPFGSRVAWPEDWARRFELVQASLTVVRIGAFAGVRFGPLAVAAGPSIDLGRLELTRAIDLVDTEGRTSLETTATGVGAQLGAWLRAGQGLDLGLSYRSRSKLALSGWADFEVPPELSGRAADQRVETSLLLPDRIALGVRWAVRDDLALSADVEAVLWSTVDALVIDFESEATADLTQRRDWRSTLAPRLGAEWRLLERLVVRAGAFFDPSPTPVTTVGPASPDSSRLGLSAGVGVRVFGPLELDLAYQHLELLGATAEADAVRYSGRIDLVGAALRATL